MANELTPETIDAQEARRRTVARLQAANGHVPVARRLNGANGHAPAAPPPEQINWAPLLAQQELRHEKQIAELAELKEQVAELAARKSGGLSAGEIRALARGLVPFLNEQLAAAAAPLNARIDELEGVLRSLVEWRARNG